MSMVPLIVGATGALVDSTIFELARKRCWVDRFRGEFKGEAFEVIRSSSKPDVAPPGDPGRFQVSGQLVKAELPDVPFSAEAALRLVYYLEATRRGGLLLHASGVVLGDQAIIAAGPSGAGKSTFAELSLLGRKARLLSDEIVAVFPDGTCHGTPFRSSLMVPGAPESVRIRSLFTLRKAGHEALRSLPAEQVVPLLLAQAYRAPVEPLTPGETLRRLHALTSSVPCYEFSFRKEPSVAEFLSGWIRS